MKTTYKTSILTAILALLFAVNLSASNLFPTFSEKSYINDIPFDTEMIYEQVTMPEFDFEEEAYINDIPCEVLCAVTGCGYEKAISIAFDSEEELFIDDLPFDTEKIASEYILKSVRSREFKIIEEEYIDDIPFSTCLIASNATKNNLKGFFISEKQDTQSAKH